MITRLFFLLFCVLSFSQNTRPETKKIPIKDFLEMTGLSIDEIDSRAFLINGNDTLINIAVPKDNGDYINDSGKKIRKVPFDYRDESFLKLYKSIAFQNIKTEDSLNSMMIM